MGIRGVSRWECAARIERATEIKKIAQRCGPGADFSPGLHACPIPWRHKKGSRARAGRKEERLQAIARAAGASTRGGGTIGKGTFHPVALARLPPGHRCNRCTSGSPPATVPRVIGHPLVTTDVATRQCASTEIRELPRGEAGCSLTEQPPRRGARNLYRWTTVAPQPPR